jgi:hypothetical protein
MEIAAPHQDPLLSPALLAGWRSPPLTCSTATRLGGGASSGGDNETGDLFLLRDTTVGDITVGEIYGTVYRLNGIVYKFYLSITH